ncbi:alpha-amylase family glycosyl hydrolase [Salinispira pacifica]|uniref:Glycosyl hydrolase family 13 catalytic domain-containing protein n=1 Tax=Salinispira pacifica TaxID=1307761 RepID=V5WIU8_9SPIO|nr:alpha-amylase family glycosyl hydrolase [Salinispira pacifica]AHC15530.1 hypothetical protein L21SP2_2167 [Salinispira pacifica]
MIKSKLLLLFAGLTMVFISCGKKMEEPLPADYALGSQYINSDTGTRFAVYAPGAEKVAVSGNFNDWSSTPMYRDGETFWVEISDAGPGDTYKFRSESFEGEWIADPYSRLITNDEGANSVVLDPSGASASYSWGDGSWSRPERDQLVIYEMHIQDFTWQVRSGPVDNSANIPGDQVQTGHEGTYAGVADRVEYLEALGVNAVELMPVQEWPGGFYSWGYNPYIYTAIESSMGSGSGEQALVDFKHMVDTLHQAGIAVIVDVVYNHTTGDAPLYKINSGQFYDGDTDWGPRLDLTNDFVYEHVKHSLTYLMDEFRVDGFRFDSTQNSDSQAMIDLIDDLYAAGYDDRYYIFEEFDGGHNSAIQNYNSGKGEARISSWGAGFKDAMYPALSDAGYSNLPAVTYHSQDYGYSYSDSAIAYASSHDEGTLYYHAGGPQLALTSLTHKLTSLSVPMFWMGDEIMRDHRGNSDDPVSGSGSGVDVENNQMNWSSLLTSNADELAYVQELLAMREAHPSLRRGVSNPDTNGSSFSDGFAWQVNTTGSDWDHDGVLGYALKAPGDRPFLILMNYKDAEEPGFGLAQLPAGTWTLVADSSVPQADSSLTGLGSTITVAVDGTGSVNIPANTALIYVGP